jgi:hypothetical protein
VAEPILIGLHRTQWVHRVTAVQKATCIAPSCDSHHAIRALPGCCVQHVVQPVPWSVCRAASLSRARMPMRDRRADEAIQQNRRWLAL